MARTSPVIVDGLVTSEKVAELLALGTEYPELDYKDSIDLKEKRDLMELAKDVAAMRVRGGYLLIGVNDQGSPTGNMDSVNHKQFDEANLVPKLLRYIAHPLELHTSTIDWKEHSIVIVCVPASSRGCAFFCADGKYTEGGHEKVVFRAGDVFWRDGTRSVRLSQEGLEEVIARRADQRIDDLREEWVKVHREIQRQEEGSPDSGARSGDHGLHSITFDQSSEKLNLSALELVRVGDTVALKHLLKDAAGRARIFIEHEDIDHGLSSLLDKITCLAATLLDYGQEEYFDQAIEVLVTVYGMPTNELEVKAFGSSTQLDPSAISPQVWLAVIERVFALGGMAVRGKKWRAVRQLTLQLPEVVSSNEYDRNWLRHALTMASRARHFERDNQKLSLISTARLVASRLGCLRSDGLSEDDDESLTTRIAQFDFLANVVALDDSPGIDSGQVFYPNFARFYQDRVQSVADRLLTDDEMKMVLWKHDDRALAGALQEIGELAKNEGVRYDGFHGWTQTPVGEFIAKHTDG